jgi:peptidoglycan/xylan/chitin deacetylase (PgdA/CDA1 family)
MVKVINLHKVTDTAWFNKLIILLKANYKLISSEALQEYYLNGKPIEKAIHITFDDGDRSFFNNAYPVLNKHKIPSSIFISPLVCEKGLNFWFQEIAGYNPLELQRIISKVLNIHINLISKYNPDAILMCLKLNQILEIIKLYQDETKTPPKNSRNMSLEQLWEVGKSGSVNIGAHTLNHPILANEDDDVSRSEIESSVDYLASLLGHSINSFAYPNGTPGLDFSEREMKYLKSKGIHIAFSTEHRNTSFGDNLLSIPRFGITYGSMNFIRTKLVFGNYWDKVKEMTEKSHSNERKEINEIINNECKHNTPVNEQI